MPATSSCVPCCTTPQVVNTPGSQGLDGSAGTNGLNALSITTADFVIPAIGSNVTVSVDSSVWMAIGQIVVADGPATFEVISKANTTSVVLKFLGYTGDLSPGATISTGATIAPAGVLSTLTTPLTVYASGTAYQLTATPAKLDFGTTDPALPITAPGTYLLLARVRYDYNGKTFAANQTLTTKLRRTNNTAADIANSSCDFETAIITTLSYTAGVITTPPVVYTTLNSDDNIEIWASLTSIAGAGTVDAVEACIVAVKLF